MPNAEKLEHFQKAVEFNSYAPKDNRSGAKVLTPKAAEPSDDHALYRIVNAHMVTMSKQLERVMSSTEHLLKKPQIAPQSVWPALSISLAVLTLLGLGGFFAINHLHNTHITELAQNTNQQLSNVRGDLNQKFLGLEQRLNSEQTHLESFQKDMHQRLNHIEAKDGFRKDQLTLQQQQLATQQKTLERLTDLVTTGRLPASPLNTGYQSQVSKNMAVFELLDKVQLRQNNQRRKTSSANNASTEQNFSQVYLKKAWAHSQEGDYASAIKAYKQAIAYDPSSAIAYYNLACCLARTGQNSEALEAFQAGKPYFSQEMLQNAQNDPDLGLLLV